MSRLTTLPSSSRRNLVFNITTMLQYGPQWDAVSLTILCTLGFIGFCPLVPRFILDLRELYDRDTGGRWQGVDTAFGVSSHPVSNRGVTASAISFAEVGFGPEEGGEAVDGRLDDLEVVRHTVIGHGTRQV